MAAIWPDSAELGFAASLGYLGYTGRAADVVATAARDPKAVLASRDDGRFWLTTNMKHVPVASLVRGFYTQMSFAGNSLDRSTFGPDVREGDSQECGHAIQCHGSPARLGRPLKYDIDFRLNGCLCDIAHIDAFSFCPPQGTNRQKRVSRGDVRSINCATLRKRDGVVFWRLQWDIGDLWTVDGPATRPAVVCGDVLCFWHVYTAGGRSLRKRPHPGRSKCRPRSRKSHAYSRIIPG